MIAPRNRHFNTNLVYGDGNDVYFVILQSYLIWSLFDFICFFVVVFFFFVRMKCVYLLFSFKFCQQNLNIQFHMRPVNWTIGMLCFVHTRYVDSTSVIIRLIIFTSMCHDIIAAAMICYKNKPVSPEILKLKAKMFSNIINL